MELDTGYENSQPDGTAKQPHKLPERATRQWNIEEAVADRYVLQFELAAGNDPERVIPGYFNGESWQPFTKPECIIESPYEIGMIAEDGLVIRNGAGDGEPTTGFDNQHGGLVWVVLESEIGAALIERWRVSPGRLLHDDYLIVRVMASTIPDQGLPPLAL